MTTRNIQNAAMSLINASHDRLMTLAKHDPDIIREVAMAAIRLPRKPCALCADKDPECELCGGAGAS